jgi:hypothetical protein
VDDALAADQARDAAAAAAATPTATPPNDVRGTTGTAPPDGSGKPGTTLPTVPANSPEGANQPTPGSASN